MIVESELSFFDRIGQAMDLYRGKREINALVYTPAEWERLVAEKRDLIMTVLAEGRVVYEREAAA